jgi:endonuclease-3
MNKIVQKKVVRVDQILAREYGTKKFNRGTDPLTELVVTILSQNTNDTNRDRAFAGLKAQFPAWKDVVKAPPEKLAAAIKVGGLAKIKSERIVRMLKSLQKAHGELDLDFLENMTDEQVREYLLKIDGVGPKTAACVLAFSLGRDVMPVDTHVHRVSSRLGLLPAKMTAEQAHDYFLQLSGTVGLYQFHLNLIAHGRQVCKAQHPSCDKCKLKRLCRFYAQTSGSKEAAA